MATDIDNKSTAYPDRQSIRLPEYDYSRPGYYFVTICIDDYKQRIFGNMIDEKMIENKFGKIVRDEWNKTAIVRPYVKLDEFIVMPNHMHGIIQLRTGTACRAHPAPDIETETGTARRAPTGNGVNSNKSSCRVPVGTTEQFGKPTIGTIPTIIRSFKSAVSKNVHQTDKSFKWQRGYFEHVIRDEKSLYFIRKYIQENPLQWDIDSENHIARELQEFKMIEIGR